MVGGRGQSIWVKYLHNYQSIVESCFIDVSENAGKAEEEYAGKTKEVSKCRLYTCESPY